MAGSTAIAAMIISAASTLRGRNARPQHPESAKVIWMVHAEEIGNLLDAATRLGRALEDCSLIIPCRNEDTVTAAAACLTVH